MQLYGCKYKTRLQEQQEGERVHSVRVCTDPAILTNEDGETVITTTLSESSTRLIVFIGND